MIEVSPLTPSQEARLNDEFERLCDRYRQQLERAALALTGDPDEAADLVQETLVRAFRYFRNFEAGSNFRAWALRILHNTHISRYRQRQRTRDIVAWDDIAEHSERRLEEAETDARATPEGEVLANLPDEEIQLALERLPDTFRQVIVMADLRELSYAEIGRRLKLPIGTVRSRLFRARQRLRDMLADYAVRNGFIRPDELPVALPSAA